MKNEILSWLTDPDRTIESGLTLYQKYGVNKNMFRFYANSTDQKMIMSSLDNELRLAAGISPIAKLKMQSKAKEVKPLSASPEYPDRKDPYPVADKRPAELNEIYEQKKQLYIETKQMSSHMVSKGDMLVKLDPNSEAYKILADERAELAGLIMKNWEEIDAAWIAIDYFQKNGKLPDPAREEIKCDVVIQVDQSDPMQLDKRYVNLRTYISKYRKNPDKHLDKLVTYINEMNAIAVLLNDKLGENKYKLYSLETYAAID